MEWWPLKDAVATSLPVLSFLETNGSGCSGAWVNWLTRTHRDIPTRPTLTVSTTRHLWHISNPKFNDDGSGRQHHYLPYSKYVTMAFLFFVGHHRICLDFLIFHVILVSQKFSFWNIYCVLSVFSFYPWLYSRVLLLCKLQLSPQSSLAICETAPN